MRGEPPAPPRPTVPAAIQAPRRPPLFNGMRPARIATIDRPSNVIASIAGMSKARISGRATRMKEGQHQRAQKPPRTATRQKAADKRAARLAFFFASGKTVQHGGLARRRAGIPRRRSRNVSDVGTTAISPPSAQGPTPGPCRMMKASTRLRPAMPPRPGNTPTDRP